MNANSLPTPSSSIRTRLLQRGETLFCQGDETFAIFVVRRGQVRLVRHLEDGSDVLLHTARVGSTFSEAALFSPAYHCDAIASADSEIEVHPKAALLAALEEDAAAAQSFMAHMARQIIALRSRLENRNIRSAEERVLHLLRLKMAGKERRVTFAEPLKDVAREAGLTHEAFYRALSRLQSQGQDLPGEAYHHLAGRCLTRLRHQDTDGPGAVGSARRRHLPAPRPATSQ